MELVLFLCIPFHNYQNACSVRNLNCVYLVTNES